MLRLLLICAVILAAVIGLMQLTGHNPAAVMEDAVSGIEAGEPEPVRGEPPVDDATGPLDATIDEAVEFATEPADGEVAVEDAVAAVEEVVDATAEGVDNAIEDGSEALEDAAETADDMADGPPDAQDAGAEEEAADQGEADDEPASSDR